MAGVAAKYKCESAERAAFDAWVAARRGLGLAIFPAGVRDPGMRLDWRLLDKISSSMLDLGDAAQPELPRTTVQASPSAVGDLSSGGAAAAAGEVTRKRGRAGAGGLRGAGRFRGR